jgi:hypothetical protein
MKNLLAENMRRFGTKNLKENIKTNSDFTETVKDIMDGGATGENMTDTILAELGDFYTEVYNSGDTNLIRLYNQLRMSADETPDIQRYAASKLFKYLNENEKYGIDDPRSLDELEKAIVKQIKVKESGNGNIKVSNEINILFSIYKNKGGKKTKKTLEAIASTTNLKEEYNSDQFSKFNDDMNNSTPIKAKIKIGGETGVITLTSMGKIRSGKYNGILSDNGGISSIQVLNGQNVILGNFPKTSEWNYISNTTGKEEIETNTGMQDSIIFQFIEFV